MIGATFVVLSVFLSFVIIAATFSFINDEQTEVQRLYGVTATWIIISIIIQLAPMSMVVAEVILVIIIIVGLVTLRLTQQVLAAPTDNYK